MTTNELYATLRQPLAEQPDDGSPAARVARGAEVMDREVPGWERGIDLGRLDILSPHDCIVGQTAVLAVEGYGTTVLRWAEAAGVPVWSPLSAYRWARRCGFTSDTLAQSRTTRPEGWDPDDATQVEAAWIGLIKERFASGLLSDQAEGAS